MSTTTNRAAGPQSPERPPLIRTGMLGALGIIGTCAVLYLIGVSVLSMIGTGLLIAALTAGVIICWWRSWQRQAVQRVQLVAAVFAGLGAGVNPQRVKLSRYSFGSLLTPGYPRQLKINLAGLANLDPLAGLKLPAMLSELAGVEYQLNDKRSVQGRKLVIQQRKSAPEQAPGADERSEKQRAEDRVSAAARQELGEAVTISYEWAVDEMAAEATEYLKSVEITEIAQPMQLAQSGKRNQIATRIRSQIPGDNSKFRYAAYPNEDRMRFFRPTPLPRMVMPPRAKQPLLRNHQAYTQFRVPLAMGPDGQVAAWHPEVDPHLLIAGITGSGKTIALHGVIQKLAQAGWRTWLIDGKQVELSGYREYPNVEYLAQDTDAQIRLLKLAHDTMKTRYEMVRDKQVRAAEFDPIVLVVDEWAEFFTAANNRYATTKTKNDKGGNPVQEWLSSLLRLGRTAKVHVVTGIQRPDAALFGGGEPRFNFGARLSCGAMSDSAGAAMMWGSQDGPLAMQVPRVRGRGVGLIDGVPTQVQTIYNANPDSWHAKDHHPGMIEEAWPEAEIYTRKTIAEPEPQTSDDGEEEALTWANICEAKLLDSNQHEVIFDPVASEESRRMRRARPQPGAGRVAADFLPRPAQDYAQGLAMCPDPGLAEAMEHGGQAVAKARLILPAVERPEDDQQQLYPIPEESGPVQTSTPIQDHPMHTVEAPEIVTGMYITDESTGIELLVSQVEPDQTGQTLTITGYTDEGEKHVMPIEISGTVEARQYQEEFEQVD